MNILALDASGIYVSAAVLKDDKIVGDMAICNGLVHSSSLLPMIEQVLSLTGMRVQDMEAFAVTVGPGSFTGVRIGVCTAKGLAQNGEKPCVPVNTLEALAYTITADSSVICPIMDARREQVYTAVFDGERKQILEPQATGITELLEELKKLGRDVIFCGEGTPVFRSIIEAQLGAKAHFAPAHLNYTRAASVAQLAAKAFEKGQWVSCFELDALYLRKPQAEREYERKAAL